MTLTRRMQDMLKALRGGRKAHWTLSGLWTVPSKAYDPRGRYEDEATARQMDGEIRDMLIELGYAYTVMPTTPDAVREYCDKLLK